MFSPIPEILEELRAGRMIVLVDDEDRENEGDLVIAAECVKPEAINFMAQYGRGLICLALTGERIKELNLHPMAPEKHLGLSNRVSRVHRGGYGRHHRHQCRGPSPYDPSGRRSGLVGP